MFYARRNKMTIDMSRWMKEIDYNGTIDVYNHMGTIAAKMTNFLIDNLVKKGDTITFDLRILMEKKE